MGEGGIGIEAPISVKPQAAPDDKKPERVSLGAEIRNIRQVIADQVGEINTELLDPESYQKWNEQKPERNALLAIIISNTFKRTLSIAPERPPFGVLHQEERKDYTEELKPAVIRSSYQRIPYQELAKKDFTEAASLESQIGRDLATTLEKDLQDELIEIEGLPQTDFRRRVWDRLNSMTRLVWNNGEIVGGNEEGIAGEQQAYRMITGGMETIATIMSTTMFTTSHVYYREHGRFPTPQEQSEIAKNSFRVLAKVAGTHLDELGDLTDRITLDGEKIKNIDRGRYPFLRNDFLSWDPEMFDIKKAPDGGLMMEIKEDKWEKVMQEIREKRASKPPSVATSCPAMAPSGSIPEGQDQSANVVKGIWEMYADIIAKA